MGELEELMMSVGKTIDSINQKTDVLEENIVSLRNQLTASQALAAKVTTERDQAVKALRTLVAAHTGKLDIEKITTCDELIDATLQVADKLNGVVERAKLEALAAKYRGALEEIRDKIMLASVGRSPLADEALDIAREAIAPTGEEGKEDEKV